MKIKSFLIISFLLVIIPIKIIYMYFFSPFEKKQGDVAGIENIYQTNNIINSLYVGEFRFTLFGYTSPFAEVTFSGQGIFDKTTADKNGYFEFKNRFSPFSPREACLMSKDQFGRISSPLCLPPFPVRYNVEIGPVIMPPTVSLNKNGYFIGDKAILTGQTVPNSDINLSIFVDKKFTDNFISSANPFFPKAVEAFSMPKLKFLSDKNGNFSISLPSSSSKKYRLFVQTGFKNSYSPNSLVLKLKIEPIWMIFVKYLLIIIKFIQSRLLEIIIISEIIALAVYFKKIFFHPYYLQNKNAIVLYEEKLPQLKENRLPQLINQNN